MVRAVALLFVCVLLPGCGDDASASTAFRRGAVESSSTPLARSESAVPGSREPLVDLRLLSRFRALERPDVHAVRTTPAMVDLGRMLFHEARLSAGHGLSCNSCHDLASYGVDGSSTSTGHGGQLGSRNAPTVFNASQHFALFWDGRAATVEEQATGPMLNPAEMAGTEVRILATLNSMPEYGAAFSLAFPSERTPVSMTNVARAVGAFERQLSTRSAWDDYLEGNVEALTVEQEQGLATFLQVGCVTCHTGPEVGASLFQRLGAVVPWPDASDAGRMGVTGRELDRGLFKVPTMRNVTQTGPWFHDGSAHTLTDAIRRMGLHQLGLELTDAEVASIEAFLQAFTGPLPEDLIAVPVLPPSTAGTPPALEG